MRALNRHVERVFNPARKERHWGKRKLARTIESRPMLNDRSVRQPSFWPYPVPQEGSSIRASRLKQSKRQPVFRQSKTMHSASRPPESTLQLWEDAQLPPS